jgi:hypothetical protein
MSSVWSHTGNAADNIVGPLVVRERPRETIDIALLASSSKHFVEHMVSVDILWIKDGERRNW